MRQRLQATEGKRALEGSRVGSVEERKATHDQTGLQKVRSSADLQESQSKPQDLFKSLSALLAQTQVKLLAGLQTRPPPLHSEMQSLVLTLFQWLSDGLWPLFFNLSVQPGRTVGNVKELMRKIDDLEREKTALKEKYEERLGKMKKSRLGDGRMNLSMTQEYGGIEEQRKNRTAGRRREPDTTTRVPSLNSSTSSSDLSHLRHSSTLHPRQFLPLRQTLKAPRSISPANPTLHSLRTDLQRCRTMLEATQQERDALKAWKEARIRKGEEGKGDEGERKRLLTRLAILQHRGKGLGIAVQRMIRVASAMVKTVRDKDLLLHFETSRAELEVLLREAFSDSKITAKTPPLPPQFETETRLSVLEKDKAEAERKGIVLAEALSQAQRQLEVMRTVSKPNLIEKYKGERGGEAGNSVQILSSSQLESYFQPFLLCISQQMHQISVSLDQQDQALTRLAQAVRSRLQDQLKSLILVNDLLTQESNIEEIRSEKEDLERVLAATQHWASSRVKELEGLLDQACTAGSVRLDSAVVRAKDDLIHTLESDVSALSQYKETALTAISGLEAALRNREAEVRELQYELGRLEEREKEAREGERRKAEELVTVQAAFEREIRETQRKAEESLGSLPGKKEPGFSLPPTSSTSESILLPHSNPISRPSSKKFLLDRPDSRPDKPLFSFLEQLNPIPTPSFSGLNLDLGTGKSEDEEAGKRYAEYERKMEKMTGEMGILEGKVRELEDLLEGQRQLYHLEKDQLLSRYEQSESALSACKQREQALQAELRLSHPALSDLAATCTQLEKEKEDLRRALESLKSLLRKEGTQDLDTLEESSILNWAEEGENSGKERGKELDVGRIEGSSREGSTPPSSLPSSPRLRSLSLLHSLLRPYTQPPDDLQTTLSRLIDEFEKLRKRKTGVVVPKLVLRQGLANREIQTSPKGETGKGIEGKGSPESGNRGISAQSTEQDTPRRRTPQITADQLYNMHSRLQSLEQEVLEAARARELAEEEVRKVREERGEMAPGVGEMKEILLKVLSLLPKQ